MNADVTKDAYRNRTIGILFSMVLITLIANSVLTYLNLRKLDTSVYWVNHTHEVLFQLESVLATVIDAETGQRGYLITHEPAYLDPYNDAMKELSSKMANLKTMVGESEVQEPLYADLQMRIKRRIDRIAETIRLRDLPGGEQSAKDAVKSGEGKVAMDAIREIIRDMAKHENELLADRTRDAQDGLTTAMVTGGITSLLGIAMVLVGFVLVHRDIARRDAVSQAMQRNLELLEERVHARTAQITEANNFLRDEVTERRKAEEAAIQLTDELQRSNRELEQFASVASHDLQEPLRKIQAFGDRLRDKFRPDLPQQAQDYLDRMLASATRMRSLINDLLVYSRVTTKIQPFSAVDLRTVGLEVSIDLEARLQQTGGQIDIGELPTIEADPLQMRQLLQNLLGNALKFHKPDVPPLVQVSGRLLPEGPSTNGDSSVGLQCEITVQDNGIGFAQEYADRIFQLFQRLHGREEFEGTGMGLAICRKIVDRHGGVITVESSPGQGARFVVRLPVHQPVQGSAA